jgi:hypothetical protein
MPYYDTLDEDLARAKEILAKGRPKSEDFPYADPADRAAAVAQAGGHIFGMDMFAAYKLLESFVAEIARLQHALNDCEIHKDVEGIAERTACAVCFTEQGNDVEKLENAATALGEQWRAAAAQLSEVQAHWLEDQAEIERLRAGLRQAAKVLADAAEFADRNNIPRSKTYEQAALECRTLAGGQ